MILLLVQDQKVIRPRIPTPVDGPKIRCLLQSYHSSHPTKTAACHFCKDPRCHSRLSLLRLCTCHLNSYAYLDWNNHEYKRGHKCISLCHAFGGHLLKNEQFQRIQKRKEKPQSNAFLQCHVVSTFIVKLRAFSDPLRALPSILFFHPWNSSSCESREPWSAASSSADMFSSLKITSISR